MSRNDNSAGLGDQVGDIRDSEIGAEKRISRGHDGQVVRLGDGKSFRWQAGSEIEAINSAAGAQCDVSRSFVARQIDNGLHRAIRIARQMRNAPRASKLFTESLDRVCTSALVTNAAALGEIGDRADAIAF